MLDRVLALWSCRALIGTFERLSSSPNHGLIVYAMVAMSALSCGGGTPCDENLQKPGGPLIHVPRLTVWCGAWAIVCAGTDGVLILLAVMRGVSSAGTPLLPAYW